MRVFLSQLEYDYVHVVVREINAKTLHDVELIWTTTALFVLEENILHTLKCKESILNLIFLQSFSYHRELLELSPFIKSSIVHPWIDGHLCTLSFVICS